MDARRFAAFCSPNLPPLATVGADVTSKRVCLLADGGRGVCVGAGDLLDIASEPGSLTPMSLS